MIPIRTQWVSGEPEMKEERSLRRVKARFFLIAKRLLTMTHVHSKSFAFRYLVIASDGLWDVMRNDEVPRIVSCDDFFGWCACDMANELSTLFLLFLPTDQ